MKKLCLFDMDGTLIDPHVSITSAMQHALAIEDIQIEDRSVLNSFIGPPIRESLKEFYHFTEPKQVERILHNYREHFLEHGIYTNDLYPGIVEMLQQLQDAGFTLAIATSKLMLSAELIAKHLEIDRYFDLIIGCEYDGRRSSKGEVIECVLGKLDPKREYSPVIIGDRKYDIIGARETGIDSIGVTWGYGSREELEREQPGHIVESVAELHQVLQASLN